MFYFIGGELILIKRGDIENFGEIKMVNKGSDIENTS